MMRVEIAMSSSGTSVKRFIYGAIGQRTSDHLRARGWNSTPP